MRLLPPKRAKIRSGIERAPRREWPRHRRFVRSHRCSVPDCIYGFMSPIEFAHWRSAANAGKGQTPHDCFGISLCHNHHAEQHDIGQPAFERKYGLNMRAIALEFTRNSPDRAMKDSLKLVEVTS